MASLTVGQVVAGHRIESVAGSGGMGVVYRARHLALNRVVALKLIAPELAQDPEFRQRFKRESETAASLDHPNVVPIYTAGEEDGLLYVTMRFVEGTDLREMITRRGRLDPREAARIVSQVASALDAAHGRGLVHRDIKPANVLIAGAQGTAHAYLTDFGLAKRASSQTALTKTGMMVGTLDYIAPEQLQGATVDARTDVYALGCVLYEAITGQVPYPRDTEPAKMWAHMGEAPPTPTRVAPDLPAPFDEIVARAMAKHPAERFLSAGDLGRATVAAAQGQLMSHTERSVATGEAAPDDATAATTTPPPRATRHDTPPPATPPARPPAPGRPQPAPVAPTLSETAARATAPPGAPPGTWSPGPPPPWSAPPRQKRSVLPLVVGGTVLSVLVIVVFVVVLLLARGGGGDGGGNDGSSDGRDGSSGSDYSVDLPAGWSEATGRPDLAESPIRVDRVFTKKPQYGFTTNVSVVREPAPEGVGLDDITPQFERQLKGLGARDLTAPRDRELDGDRAVGRDYTLPSPSGTVRGRQVFSIHDGRIYTVTFTAHPAAFEEVQAEFERILDSWRWE